jgi:hypothetical protein
LQEYFARREQDAPSELQPSRAHPIFDYVRKEAEHSALKYFDAVISRQASQLTDAIQASEKSWQPEFRQDMEVLRQRIEAAIRAARVNHFRLDDTLQAKPPDDFCLQACKKTEASLIASIRSVAEKGTSHYDRPKYMDALSDDVASRLTANSSDCQPQWQALSKATEARVTEAIKDVRRDIAKRDAESLCPKLMLETWIPDEDTMSEDFIDGVAWLRSRTDIWRGPPPEKAVLFETWQEWETRMRDLLTCGRDAKRHQQDIVTQVSQPMIGRMQKAGVRNLNQEGVSYWVNEYKQEVVGRWKDKSGRESNRYPHLFRATQERIRGIVEETLARLQGQTVVANLKPRIATEIEKALERGEKPANGELVAAYRGETQKELNGSPLFPSDSGLPDEVQQAIRDNVQELLQTTIPNYVQSRQTELVQELRPVIASEVLNPNLEQVDEAACITSYQSRVRSAWKKRASLAIQEDYPDLLVPTKQQIGGIVATLLRERRGRQKVAKAAATEVGAGERPGGASGGVSGGSGGVGDGSGGVGGGLAGSLQTAVQVSACFLLFGLLLSVYLLWRYRKRLREIYDITPLLSQLHQSPAVQLELLRLLIALYQALQPDADRKLQGLICRAQNPSPFDEPST